MPSPRPHRRKPASSAGVRNPRRPSATVQLRSALHVAEARCQAVMEVGRSLTAVHDLDELLRMVAELVTKLTGADRSTIFLVDHDRGMLWSKVVQGEEMHEIHLPVGQGIAGWVAQTGKSVNLSDAYDDHRFDKKVDRTTGYRTRSLLCVPLRGKQSQTLGAIETLNKRGGGAFTLDDERLLEAICSEVAVAVENVHLILNLLGKNAELLEAREQLSRKLEEMDLLFRLEKRISGALNLEEMLDGVLQKALEVLSCQAGSVLQVANQAGDLTFVSAVGPAKADVKSVRIPRGVGVVGWVVKHGQPAIVSDPHADERHLREIEEQVELPVHNLLAVPLVLGGETIGALEFLNKDGCCFDDNDLKLASVIAGQAAAAVQLGRHREEAQKSMRLSSVGQMLSEVIRDFRTPMSIISGYVQLMAKEEQLAERGRQSGVIMRQFDLFNDMTKELLSFAKGERTLLLNKVFTRTLFEEMSELLSGEMELAGVKMTLDDRYVGAIRVDKSKFHRLVLNLARNATEAMPEGGEFLIQIDEEGDSIRFVFTDSGPGIPPEIRDKLFDSFVTCGKADGSGLGLAVVKKIVDEHGGRVKAESPRSGGACFTVWLPKGMPGDRKN